MLTQRYAQKLDTESNLMVGNDCCQETNFQGQRWDDFDDSKIKLALHEALALKQMMKLESGKRSKLAAQVPFCPWFKCMFFYAKIMRHMMNSKCLIELCCEDLK